MPKTSSDLASQVAQRQAQVDKYVRFTLDLIHEIGKQTFYEERAWQTNVTREVKNFSGFDFMFKSRSSDEITVSMRRKISGYDYPTLTRVMAISWSGGFDIEKCHVDIFETELDWMAELDKVIKNKKKILASMETAKQTDKESNAKAAEKAKADEALRKKAIRLGLLPDENKPAF